MPSASGSMTAAQDGAATWIRHSSGQYVVSRMNSVSTAMKGASQMRSQNARSSAVVVMGVIG